MASRRSPTRSSGLSRSSAWSPFGEVGDAFDPRIHEALMHSYSDDVDGPVCVAILQVGYRIGDRIVRPARVAVAEPEESPQQPPADAAPDDVRRWSETDGDDVEQLDDAADHDRQHTTSKRLSREGRRADESQLTGREGLLQGPRRVQKDASADEIKKAYRKLARANHPDSNPGDAAAEERFKSISEAYSVLSDAEQAQGVRRAARPSSASGGFRVPPPGQGPRDFSDLFGVAAAVRERAGSTTCSAASSAAGSAHAPRSPAVARTSRPRPR